MVFFTCDGCGEPVKKPSVPKHRSQCRRSFKLSCIDCHKDFYGEEYNSHIKCISEQQKYAGAGPALNKNEKKQEEWVVLVQEAIKNAAGINPAVRQLLEYVSQFDNIPRKQAKFLNFLKNSQRRAYNDSIAQQAWGLISKELEKLRAPQPAKKTEEPEKEPEKPSAPETSEETETVENGHEHKLSKRERKEERRRQKEKVEKKDKKQQAVEEVENGTEEAVLHVQKQKKGKKRRHDEDDADVQENLPVNGVSKKKKKKAEQGTDNGLLEEVPLNTNHVAEEVEETATKAKFRWHESAAAILRTRSDQELSLKKLKKKLIAEYTSVYGDECDAEAIWTKGLKKLSKNTGFRIEKDRIRLL